MSNKRHLKGHILGIFNTLSLTKPRAFNGSSVAHFAYIFAILGVYSTVVKSGKKEASTLYHAFRDNTNQQEFLEMLSFTKET